MKARALCAALALAAAWPCGAHPQYRDSLESRACCAIIGHAGGGVDGVAYTNSEEAVLASLGAGWRVLEIDFSRTSDGVWVGAHDWIYWRRQTGYTGTLPPTHAEFTHRPRWPHGAPRPYTAITIPFLERMAARYPDLVIVSDTKYGLEPLARALRETQLFGRLYPQAYAPGDVDMLAGLGYRRIILTVYKMKLQQPDALLAQVDALRGRLHALTVPEEFFALHHARLAALGMRIYVHGAPARINSRALHERLRRQGVAGFYLDW